MSCGAFRVEAEVESCDGDNVRNASAVVAVVFKTKSSLKCRSLLTPRVELQVKSLRWSAVSKLSISNAINDVESQVNSNPQVTHV